MCDFVAYMLMIFAEWYIAEVRVNQPPDYAILERMRNRTI
jgi:hypothetical protein